MSFGDREKVALKYKIAYGLGNMGSVTLSSIFNSSAVKFYTDKVFLSPTLIGLAFLIFAIWNAINDPVFGYLSDRGTKYGRRVPFLRIMSFTYGISFILLWFPPSGFFLDPNNQFTLFLYLLVTILFFDTCYTIFGLVIAALLPEMSLDTNERTKVSQFGVAFSIVGGIGAFLIPFIFLTTTGGRDIFQLINIIIAILATVTFFICSFTIKERKEFYEGKESLGLIDAVKYCLKNKAFLYFVVFNFCLTLIYTNVITVVLYYTQHVLRLSGTAVILPLLIIFMGFLMTYIITPKLNEKYGIRKLILIMGTIGVFGMVFTLVSNIVVALIAFTVVATAVGVYAILINPMVGDICDEDERNTGLRREGAYFGVNALIVKPAISLGVFIITFILEESKYF